MSFRALLIMAFCNIAWALNVVVSKLAITDFSAPPLFYALVRSIIVAAVLTPTGDPVTLTLMAAPMMVLYALSIGIAWAASTHGREGNYLQVLGILMIGTNLGMVLTGSVPALFVLSFFNGVAWAFFPILVTIPFHLPGIKPRELAVAFAFTMMMTSGGTSLGPLFTGYLQEGLDDLKMALFLISFASISLILAGSTLRFRSQRQTA